MAARIIPGLPTSVVRLSDLAGKQDSTSVSKTTYHTPKTTAVFNGQTIDSGETPTVTGVGIATTVSSSSGYIHDPTNTNTYIFVDSGSAIKRVEQRFCGTQGVIALCAAGNANNMVHVEFPTGSTAAVTYGATSGGFPQYPDLSKTIATIPDINDGAVHTLAVEVDGDLVTAFVDDVCVGFAYDPLFSTLVGNWYYVQITAVTANCKIYGFSSFDEIPQRNSIVAGSVRAAAFQSQVLHVGRVADASFEPTTSIHLWTNDERMRIEGKTYSVVTQEALGAGSVARTEYLNAIGVQLNIGVEAANGLISYQGNSCITFPVNGYVAGTYMELQQFSTPGIVASSWPTADPTGGKLWLKGGIVRHGADSAPAAATSLGLGTSDDVWFSSLGIGREGFAGHLDLYDDIDDVTIEIDAIQGGIQVGGKITATGRVTAETMTLSAGALTLHSTGIIAGAATVSATEVGYLDGVTSAVQTQIDGKADMPRLENRHEMRDFAKGMSGFRTAPTTNRVGIAGYGDSVSQNIPESICNWINNESFQRAEIQSPSAMRSALVVTYSGTALTYNGLTVSVLSQSTMDGSDGGADFTYLASAAHLTFANGSIVTFDASETIGYSEARVYFATGPGFGSAFVELINRDTSAVISSTTVNLSAGSIGATKAQFATLKTNKYRIRVTSTGVSVLLHVIFLKPHGVFPVALGRGGCSLSQNNYSNETILRYLVSDLNIKLIGCEAKEEGGSVAIAATMSRLAAIPNVSSLVIGSLPDASSSVTQLANVALFRQHALANDLAFFNGYEAFGDYTELARLGWEGDGTHPTLDAHDYVGGLIIGEMPWLNSLGGSIQKSVNHASVPDQYVASYSHRVFKGDNSLETIEFAKAFGGGSPTTAVLKNIGAVYFDADGTTLAYITGRDSGSVRVFTSAGGDGYVYAGGVQLTNTTNYAIYVGSGGMFLGKDCVFLTAARGPRYGSESGPLDCGGAGTPEGAITAPVGSTYRRSDGGAGTSFYVKESGTGNTGWVAK